MCKLTSCPSLRLVILLCLLPLILAGCGGRVAPSGADESASAPSVPTMPPARFTAVAEQSVTQTVSLSTTALVTAAADVTVTAVTSAAGAAPLAVDPALLERGARSYTRNNCGDCHGMQGEGVADKGSALAGMTLSLSEFDNVLRTGGGLGNTHIFGPSAVSPTGMDALYAYVQSLQ